MRVTSKIEPILKDFCRVQKSFFITLKWSRETKRRQMMDKKLSVKNLIVGLQHLVAMFGATVLVPAITGFNPAVALLAAGIGTLIFHSVTKRKVPVLR